MHKRIPILLSLLALGLTRLTSANDIEPGKEFLTATKAAKPVTLDGKLDEWTGVPVTADPKFSIPKGSGTNGTYVLFEVFDLGGPGPADWTGPSDQTSAVQVEYDADNVYVGVTVTDEYFENAANSPWNGDSVQLYIANASRDLEVAKYNYALGGVEGATGEVFVQHEGGPAGNDECACATDAKITRDSVAKKTYYEIKLPAGSLGLTAPLTAGTKFGLGMAVNDGDEAAPGQQGWGGLGVHSIVHGKTPSETALITLGTNGPGTDKAFLSAINPTVGAFTFRANDKGAAVVVPSSAKLTINGQVVPLTASPKSGDATDFTYKPAAPFVGGSANTYAIEIKDAAGNTISDTGTFATPRYTALNPLDKATADTNKPGFLWRIFANSAVTTDSNQRTEDALAGKLKGSDGNPLPNLADPTALGVALAAAAPPSPDNAPITFEIPEVINLSMSADTTQGNFQPDLQMPGVPATDSSNNGLAVELLTYLDLPAGLLTMGVNSDDGFRTTGMFVDAFTPVLGEYNGGRGAADTLFNIYVPEAGVYGFRTIYEQGGGDANIEWFTVAGDGTKTLINAATTDASIKAYRSRLGATPPRDPSFTAVSPLPVPRQVDGVSSSVVVTLTDGDTKKVDENSIALKIDGTAVTATKVRTGTNVTVTYTPTGLQVPADKHTAELSFKDISGTFSRTQKWSFLNLKNIVVPTPKVTENFDSYPEDTQPTGWVAWNYTAHCADGRDITSQGSESYENWVLVSTNNAPSIDGGSLNVAPGQTFNGQPVTTISSGNVLYAESDSRCNTDALERGYVGQTQFIVSKPFDLSTVTNVLLTFSALYTQNQDSYGGVEYSINGGTNWLPIVYYLDGPDIVLNSDGSIDAVATFTAPNNDTSQWVVNGVTNGAGAHGYGDAVGAPITQALADYIAPRVNDDQTGDARIEIFRLPAASKQKDVRLRFSAMGTDSWWFAVDNIAFYDAGGAAPATGQPKFNAVTVSGGNLTISWTGTGTLEQSDTLPGTWTAAPSQANPQTVSTTGKARFYRIKQ